jgi:hypothetical protein
MTASDGSAEAQKGVVDNSNDRARCGAATTASAKRQQQYRRRQASGALIVRIELGPEVRRALIANQWIGAAQREHRPALADAVHDLLDAWARGALQNAKTPPSEPRQNTPDAA